MERCIKMLHEETNLKVWTDDQLLELVIEVFHLMYVWILS